MCRSNVVWYGGQLLKIGHLLERQKTVGSARRVNFDYLGLEEVRTVNLRLHALQ